MINEFYGPHSEVLDGLITLCLSFARSSKEPMHVAIPGIISIIVLRECCFPPPPALQMSHPSLNYRNGGAIEQQQAYGRTRKLASYDDKK